MTSFRFPTAICIALVASAYALPAVHPIYGGEKCTPAGMRCAGEKGYPAVPWLGCCNDGDACIPDETKGYGRFCMKKPTDYGKGKCYPSGSKCMGAEGKPYVPFHHCCKASESCQTDPALGWGGFCKSHGSSGKEKKYEDAKPKCYKKGEKCMGGSGYPYVQFYHCCSESESCMADPSLGWGGYCKRVEAEKEYTKKYGSEEPKTKYNPEYAYKSSDYKMAPKEEAKEKAEVYKNHKHDKSYAYKNKHDQKEAVDSKDSTDYYGKANLSSYSADTGYDYGYGKHSKKARSSDYDKKTGATKAPSKTYTVAPTSTIDTTDPVAVDLNLPANFGCSALGGATADREPEFEFMNRAVATFDLAFVIPQCMGGAITEAEKDQVSAEICAAVEAPLRAVQGSAQCYVKQLPVGTVTVVIAPEDGAEVQSLSAEQIAAIVAAAENAFALRFPSATIDRTIIPVPLPSPDA